MDDPILRQAGATAQYYHQDGLGSVVAITDQTGATLGSQRFDAWGNKIAGTGTIPQYGYTGREPDETGLVYYRARYYDPSVGRFTQRDPIGLSGGINPYAYVGNNPTNLTDPLGLEPKIPAMDWENVSYSSSTPGMPSGNQSLAQILSQGVQVADASNVMSDAPSSFFGPTPVTGGQAENLGLTPREHADFNNAVAGSPFERNVKTLASRDANGYERFVALIWLGVDVGGAKGGPKGGIADDFIVVRGGIKDLPPPGEVFSGAAARTLAEAAAGVPHGQIRSTTAGAIREGGGSVQHAPELARSGVINERHVNVCLGPGPCPFGPPQPNPVPKAGRAQ